MRQETDEKLTKIEKELMACGKEDLTEIKIKSVIKKYVAPTYVNNYLSKLIFYGFLFPVKRKRIKKI